MTQPLGVIALTSIQESSLFAVPADVRLGFAAVIAAAVSNGGTLDAGLTRLPSGTVFGAGFIPVNVGAPELFTASILMMVRFRI